MYGRLLLEDDGSLSRSLSPNQEKGIQVGMDVIDSAGDRFPPDSSSKSADPLSVRNSEFSYNETPLNMNHKNDPRSKTQ